MGLHFPNHSSKVQHRANILSMKIYDGMTNKEIASQLGISAIRVSQLMHEAYKYVQRGEISIPETWEVTENNKKLVIRRRRLNVKR